MYLFTAYRLLLGAMALSFACLSLVGGMLYAFQIKWLYGTTVYYFILLLYRYHCPNDELHVLAILISDARSLCVLPRGDHPGGSQVTLVYNCTMPLGNAWSNGVPGVHNCGILCWRGVVKNYS